MEEKVLLNKKLMILAIFLVSLLAVSAVSAADNGTESDIASVEEVTDDVVAVEDNSEILNDDSTSVGNIEDLYNQINGTSDGGTVTLDKDYEYKSLSDAYVEIINKTITIDGKGHSINGNHNNNESMFIIENSNITFKNITFINGGYEDLRVGSVIYCADANLTVLDCGFKNNYAQVGGPVIYAVESNLELNRCSFNNNSAEGYGGVIAAFEGKFLINNSKFYENHADTRQGGVLYAHESILDIFNSIFVNNYAYEGGAICYRGYSPVNINSCNFINNAAESYGGAIIGEEEGELYVFDSYFKSNTANVGGAISCGNAINCTFMNNAAKDESVWSGGGYGGAIAYGDASKCTFINNTAIDGGAMVYGNALNCTFINNTADSVGGSGGALTTGNAINCTFYRNLAYYGGAIFYSNSTNCYFTENGAMLGGAMGGGTAVNCNFTRNLAWSKGGAIYQGNALNCDFTNNSAVENGFGGAVCGDLFWVVVVNCTFTENNASNGGAAYHVCADNCTFIRNTATENGGAVHSSKVSRKSKFDGNTAGGVSNNTYNATFYENEPGNSFSDLYSIINNSDSEVTLDKDYKFNPATDFYYLNGFSIGKSITIYGNGFSIDAENLAHIFVVDAENVVFNNITFVNGHSDYGGAIEGQAQAIYCTFINNTATVYAGAGYEISAVNCTFINNSAGIKGGAIYNGSAVNCTFTNNFVIDEDGGAMYYGNAVNCTFTNNLANQSGGAMYYGNAVNCTFTNNSAGWNGGAGYDISAVNCIFTDNTAINNAGGLYFGSADTCIFTDNHAKTGDDYLYTEILSPTLNVDDFIAVWPCHENLTLDLKTNISGMPVYNAFIKITIYNKTDNEFYAFSYGLSGEKWPVNLPVGFYYATFETGYEGFEPINITIAIVPDIQYYVNVTSLTTNNKTVNITAKTNIPKDIIITGKLLFILPNGTEINVNNVTGDICWAEYTFEDYSDYQVTASYAGLKNVHIQNATISIIKADSKVNVNDVVLNYGDSKNVTVTTEGATGIKAMINDAPVSVIDDYTIPISDLTAGNYTLTVTTIPDEDHNSVTKTVNVTVNKVNSTLTVEALVFDYEATGSTVVSFTGATGVKAVVNDSSAFVNVNGNTITVSNLRVGNFTLTVTTIPDENHTEVKKTANVTVNRINSTLNINNVEIDYGSSIDLTVETIGATGVTAMIDDNPVTVSNNYTIPISGLRSIGNHSLTVKTIPDENHTEVTKTVNITVKKAKSTLNLNNVEIEYGSSIDLTVTTIGTTGITAKIDNASVTVINNYTIPISGLSMGTYSLTVTAIPDENHTEVTKTVNITITKIKTQIVASAISTTYQINKNLVITLKDSNGKALSGVSVNVNLNGSKTYTTDKNGQVKLNIAKLVPKTYTAKITFKGNNNYQAASKNVKVTVKKAKAKITAKKKTFKKAKKVKKYKITLKANKKPIKKVKVTLKIKGKTYKAKTNAKGKATFKIKKLTKKGKHKATIKFKANKYYTKATKKVKIKIK